MANKTELREARELTDLNVKEVSLVDKPAIRRTFLLTKRSEDDMPFREKAEAEEEEEKAVDPDEEEGSAKAEEEPDEEEPSKKAEDEEGDEEEEETPAAAAKNEALVAALALALPWLKEQAEAADDGEVKDAAMMVLDFLEALEFEPEEEAEGEDAPMEEKAKVAKARRMTASRRNTLNSAIATLQATLKEIDGDEEEEKKTKTAPKQKADTSGSDLATSVAAAVLQAIEPRLEKMEKRVSGIETTVPAPRSAHPESKPVVKNDVAKSTEELFGPIFG